jgi:branched-chain amino acid transport system permease protein
MAEAMGPIVFVVVVFGGLGSLSGCFIASILMGLIQTFAVVIDTSLLDLIKPLGITVSGDNLFTEILTVPVARIGALLPFAMMIVMLLFRPRGLMGTRDT